MDFISCNVVGGSHNQLYCQKSLAFLCRIMTFFLIDLQLYSCKYIFFYFHSCPNTQLNEQTLNHFQINIVKDANTDPTSSTGRSPDPFKIREIHNPFFCNPPFSL